MLGIKKTTGLLVAALCAGAISVGAQTADSRFMSGFKEDFNASKPTFFETSGSSFRYSCGVDSFTEKDTQVMLLRISPDDPAGAGRGPEISTPELTHFGRYSARFRVPDIQEVQPNTGAVVGYFTYRFTRGYGLSEIDIEILIADPRLIYIGTWTSDPHNVNNLQRVGRTVNLATGEILYTNYRSYHDGNVDHEFSNNDDAALTPRTIPSIEGFDASKRFYTYGFDWYPDRLTWWIEHPQTGEKIVLWDYTGSTPNFSGIPQPPTTYLFNFWHTNNWSVDTNPASTQKPLYPYVLEIDWMSYEPFDEINAAWNESHNW